MVTAYKEGYQPTRNSKVIEIDGSINILPAIPVIGSAFAGLPSWTGYAILGAVAAAGGGIYLLRKPKAPEDDEDLIEEAGMPHEMTEATEETVEDTKDDEEEEET